MTEEPQHEPESFIKTPKQLVVIVLLGFALPIFAIVLLVLFVTTETQTGVGSDAMSAAAIQARIQPVAKLEVRDPNAPRELKTGEQVFNAQCTTCHTAGVAGAPKKGDTAEWAKRIGKGFDALALSALKGKGAMPAQSGGDFDDDEIKRAVAYITNQSGAKFPDPVATAGSATATAPPPGP